MALPTIGIPMPDTIYSSPLLEGVRKAVATRPANIKLYMLAKEIGVTRQWLGRFMNGKCSPSALTLEKLYVAVTGKQIFPDD